MYLVLSWLNDKVDHQRRQIRQPHLAAKRKNVAIDPLGEAREHR